MRAALLPLVLLLLLGQNPPSALKPSIQKVENAGLLFTDNDAGVNGTDAGYSIPLGKRTLWLFGDVFLQETSDLAGKYVGGLSNCALLCPTGEGAKPLRSYHFLTDAKTKLARAVLPNGPDEGRDVRLWPLGGWYDAVGKRVYLFYERVRTTGSGPLDFRVEGHGLAVSDAKSPEQIMFQRLPASRERELWWPREGGAPIFGSAVFTDVAGEYLYVVGLQERGGRKVGKLARVRPQQVAEEHAYHYYAGGSPPRWISNVSEAADVRGLAEFPNELSVSYNRYLGGYLAVHSVGLAGRLRLSLAEDPWGPYTPVGEIGTPVRALARGFCYAGKEHPELAEQGGRVVYVTYVDSSRYWLQLLKVTLQKGRQCGRGPQTHVRGAPIQTLPESDRFLRTYTRNVTKPGHEIPPRNYRGYAWALRATHRRSLP